MEIPIKEDLDTNPDGTIKLSPVAGWQTVRVAEMMGLLRLHYFADQQSLARLETKAIQLGMTPSQCRELGQALLRMAEKLSQLPGSDVPRN